MEYTHTHTHTHMHTDTHTHTHTQNMCQTVTAIGEVAQMLAFANSEWGLDREVRAASSVLSIRTQPECP